jgi:hypothetical protein
MVWARFIVLAIIGLQKFIQFKSKITGEINYLADHSRER